MPSDEIVSEVSAAPQPKAARMADRLRALQGIACLPLHSTLHRVLGYLCAICAHDACTDTLCDCECHVITDPDPFPVALAA